jgi:hypothetical protein
MQEPRARNGQFIDSSHRHSSLISLIYNLVTQYVTPQFHVVYDARFTTAASDHSYDMNKIWFDLFLESRKNCLDVHDPNSMTIGSLIMERNSGSLTLTAVLPNAVPPSQLSHMSI